MAKKTTGVAAGNSEAIRIYERMEEERHRKAQAKAEANKPKKVTRPVTLARRVARQDLRPSWPGQSNDRRAIAKKGNPGREPGFSSAQFAVDQGGPRGVR